MKNFKNLFLAGCLVISTSGLAEIVEGPIKRIEITPSMKRELLGETSIKPGPNAEALSKPIEIPVKDVDVGVCITEIKMKNNFVELDEDEPIQCKQRDILSKAFAGTAIVLKGASFVCKFTPHPVLQATANVWDVGAWMMGTIAYTWSIQPCTKNDDKDFNTKSLQAVCYEMNKMGLDCRGVAP